MSATLELNLFSGLPNVTWRLDDQEAKDLRGAIQSLPLQPPGFHPIHSYLEPLGRPRSGYRGVTIEFSGPQGSATYDIYDKYVYDYQTDRVRLDNLAQLTKRILSSIPKPLVADFLNGMTVEQIQIVGHEAAIKGIKGVTHEALCEHAPAYSGNSGPFNQFRLRNNCYNYATGVVNQVPGKQAIPGRPNIGPPLTEAKLLAGLADDGFELLGQEVPQACPTEGNRIIAVLIRHHPTGLVRDFHCLRRDKTGRWSHKDGQGEVRNVDDNGTEITDIKTAALSWDPELVGFFNFSKTKRGNID